MIEEVKKILEEKMALERCDPDVMPYFTDYYWIPEDQVTELAQQICQLFLKPDEISPYSLPSDACDKYFAEPDRPELRKKIRDLVMDASSLRMKINLKGLSVEQVYKIADQILALIPVKSNIPHSAQLRAILEYVTAKCLKEGECDMEPGSDACTECQINLIQALYPEKDSGWKEECKRMYDRGYQKCLEDNQGFAEDAIIQAKKEQMITDWTQAGKDIEVAKRKERERILAMIDTKRDLVHDGYHGYAGKKSNPKCKGCQIEQCLKGG